MTTLRAEPLNDLQTWAAIETRSFVSVPLVRDGRFKASLFVNFKGIHTWRDEDIVLIEEVAGRVWDALQRAQAEAALRETNDNLEKAVAQRTAGAAGERGAPADDFRNQLSAARIAGAGWNVA